jgi:hypothetical protein
MPKGREDTLQGHVNSLNAADNVMVHRKESLSKSECNIKSTNYSFSLDNKYQRTMRTNGVRYFSTIWFFAAGGCRI